MERLKSKIIVWVSTTLLHGTYRSISAPSYQFVQCDVREWKEQIAVFRAAIENSPHKSIDIVVANAGIAGSDSIFQLGMKLLTYFHKTYSSGKNRLI
jgi:NAD(P)-dependent dehydrogenase (short-subunit alcohol dehydrogenase family)